MKLGEKRFDQTQQRIRNKHGSHAKIPKSSGMPERYPATTEFCHRL